MLWTLEKQKWSLNLIIESRHQLNLLPLRKRTTLRWHLDFYLAKSSCLLNVRLWVSYTRSGFPDEIVRAIFEKYGIEKVEIYNILTDTNSTSLKFPFISDPDSETPESKFRGILFEVIATSKIYKRFDSSHEFWDNFSARKEHKRKKFPNPKEYFDTFEDKGIDKKHKGIKKGSSGLGFENFSQKIKSLDNFDTFQKPPADFKVSRLTLKASEIKKKQLSKVNSLK